MNYFEDASQWPKWRAADSMIGALIDLHLDEEVLILLMSLEIEEKGLADARVHLETLVDRAAELAMIVPSARFE